MDGTGGMIALATPPIRGEAFPPEVRARKQLYAELQAAMRQSERLIARQFRAFARAIASKADYLVALSLDEYGDNVDNVLGGDLNDLTRALQVALQSLDKRVLTLGAQHAMGDPALASIDIAWDLQRPDVERYLASHATELVQGINDTTRTRLATVLRQGVRDGKSIPQITQDVMTAARSMSVERARLIAQTETLRGYNAGAVSAMRASDVVSGMRFVDGQFGACPFCQSLNGKIVKLDEGFDYAVGDRTVSAPYPPVHPGCLAGDTLVTPGGRIGAISKRWYEGDLLVIRTASGDELSITPNHPVLTPGGWVAAKLLQPGSDILRCRDPERVAALFNPDDEWEPATLHEIASAAISAGEMTAGRVPTSPEDFHGDGQYGEVDIVWSDRELGQRSQSALVEQGSHLEFERGHQGASVAVAPERIADRLGRIDRDTTNCIMCSTSLAAALFRVHPLPLNGLGFGLISDMYARVDQAQADAISSDAELLSQRIFRHPALVEETQVLDIEVQSFAGHVYNLQTEGEWYIGNNIIVHNCRCTIAPVLDVRG